MKRNILILLALLSLPLSAQKLNWYGRVGLGYNGMTGDPAPVFKAGYDLAVGFTQSLGSSSSYYWNAEGGFSSRGYQECGEQIHAGSGLDLHYKQKANALRLYAGLGKTIALGNGRLKLAPHVGLFASYDVGGSRDAWIVEDGYKHTVNADVGTGKWNEHWRELDGGAEGGIALWIGKRYAIDARYRQGFIDALPRGNYHGLTSNIIVSGVMRF